MALGGINGASGMGTFAGMGIWLRSFKTLNLAGSATAVQCPSVACSMVMFKTPKSNTGEVYIGPDVSVTVEAGTTNYTAGWELQPGQEFGPFFLESGNLDFFSYICDAGTDDLIAFVA